MTVIEQQQILEETAAARADAERLLSELIEAKAVSATQRAASHEPDHFERVTGRTSFDVAIERTRRMIDALERAVGDAEARLSACAVSSWSERAV